MMTLDGTTDDIISAITRSGPYIETVAKVVTDPAFPRVIQLVKRIDRAWTINTYGTPNPPPFAAPTTGQVRSMLSSTVPALETVAWGLENPTKSKILAWGLIVTPFLIGVLAGRQLAK